MPDGAVYDAVADRLRDGFQRFRNRRDTTEADIRQLVIGPVLTAIGYSDSYRRPEQGAGRNRPDEICYTSESVDSSGHAALIVEAKSYGANFDRATGGLSAASPDRQIQRYLRQHPASGPNTIGVLTDGIRWRVYERTGPDTFDTHFLDEYNFADVADVAGASSMLPGDTAGTLQEFVDRLCRECVLERHGAPPRRQTPDLAAQLFAVFERADGDPDPDAVLLRLLGGKDAETHYDLDDHVRLDGIREDAHARDWDAYAYALGAPLQTDAPSLEGRRAVTAAVRYSDDSPGLSRGDTALCARTFARVDGAGTSALLAYRVGPDGATEARLAVCANGRVAMTALFDPELPAPSAKAAIESVLALLTETRDALAADRLLTPLEVAPLRQRFYADVSAWTRRAAAGKVLVVREAVLRHLIRVMFTWILKEDGLIPAELFERGFAIARMRDVDRYHRDILRFLFHERLNVPADKRDPHDDRVIDEVMEDAPFLNGSLFEKQEGDDDIAIPAIDYWNADETRPGLFTILSRYHWTTDEHRPGESDQTLDPELLSNLFERLILVIEGDEDEPPDKQPRGTYYTPADVTAEMVKDALVAATRPHAPASVTDEELLDLFGDPAAPLPDMGRSEQAALAERVHALRIFDPAVGSGAFLFGCLAALRTALEKLEPDSAEPTPGIIREQLHGQDIHPLAAQITRLRLFIALKAADRKANREAPLPNLEARIVCADTLETSADPDWRPDHPGQLDTADPEIVTALTAVAENRRAWMDAHEEDEKQYVLMQDEASRGRLRHLLNRMGELASPELRSFAATPILPPPSHPAESQHARADARLLFYETSRRGFDVVIGNPPYEASSKSKNASQLIGKRYRTTNCGDLYTLFCEAALALANPDGGVVTMIVPLSIAFGQQQRTLREVFERRCATINLRHYDHMPDTLFNASPTVIQPMNGQRTTILTGIQNSSTGTTIRTTGLQHWPSNERRDCLQQRGKVIAPNLSGVDVNLSGQWVKTPTLEVAQMVQSMFLQEKSIRSYATPDGSTLGFPTTALYFMGVISHKAVEPRNEHLFTVRDDDVMRLIMAALNGHVAHGWWSVFGDGWHVKHRHMTLMTIPDAWIENPQPAIALGQRLIDAIEECTVRRTYRKREWASVNFHLKPKLIEEIDKLYIEALGLPVEPLLTHLKIMRSNRSWDFSPR